MTLEEMTNSIWTTYLSSKFNEGREDKRSVRFPGDGCIRIGGNTSQATIHLEKEAVEVNMQANEAAFEAWTLVLLRWCGVETVELSWERPAEVHKNPHYQRFLYRAERFAKLMDRQFTLRDSGALSDLRFRSGIDLHLNRPGPRVPPVPVTNPKSESELEIYLTQPSSGFRRRLSAEHGIDTLDRQFPVGVFQGPPQKGAEIFTGGKSAIDLIAKDNRKGIWIFELKTRDNRSMGGLSELFFYSMIARDIRDGIIQFENGSPAAGSCIGAQDVRNAQTIHAHLASEDFHPLIDSRLLDLLNNSTSRNGWAIDYGTFRLDPPLPPKS
jgi:hypothetical protein